MEEQVYNSIFKSWIPFATYFVNLFSYINSLSSFPF